MPDPNDVAQPQTEWNPPGGDSAFDDLFIADAEGRPVEAQPPAESLEAESPQEPEATPASQPQAVPAPKKDESFFYTYKTKEEAERGFAEKDRAIEDLRRKVIALAGVDPLKKGGQQEPQASQSYLSDPDRFARDLTEAATTKRYDRYLDTFAKAVDEVVATRYGHLIPKVEKLGRQEALEEVSSELPAFRAFHGSEDYQKALDRHPRLKEAIQVAESRPDLQADYLPDLYKTVWDVSVAVKSSESTNGGARPTPTQSTPRMPITPTSRPSLDVPDRRGAAASGNSPSMNTSAGRKALIADLEARGIKDVQF